MQNIVGLDDGLAPDQRQAIPQRKCGIYTFSGYKYTLISEWTRLFGLLRILDNLISGAVCYFLYDYFCILLNIHLTHARSCSCRHTLSCVVFMPSSGVGLVYLSPSTGTVQKYHNKQLGSLWQITMLIMNLWLYMTPRVIFETCILRTLLTNHFFLTDVIVLASVVEI